MHREAFVMLMNIKCKNIKTFTFNLGMQHRAEHQGKHLCTNRLVFKAI